MLSSAKTVQSNIQECQTCQMKEHCLVTDLQPDELELLDAEKSCNNYKKGDVIFHEGNRPFGVYSVFSGKIKVFKTSEHGKEQIIRLAKPGDPLGYRSLLSGQIYQASAKALEDSRVCFIPQTSFKRLLETGNGVMQKLMMVMTEDLRMAEERIASIATKTVRERTAESIIMLGNFYGFKEDGRTIDVSMSREDLSNLVGTATESLIRMLTEFRNDGLIELKDKDIAISDRAKLYKTAAWAE